MSQNLQEFLALKDQFRLGALVTEAVHPKTVGLAEFAKDNLPHALDIYLEVERSGFEMAASHSAQVSQMASAIRDTLVDGGRIFLCGCGATGRLSILCESMWRETFPAHPWTERVVSFMAGGDYAFVRSIENFEDHPEYGMRQLRDLNFGENDLLVSTTEGGETPFVIGATEEAARMSRRAPFFLYCNPDDLLIKKIERSRAVLLNPNIRKINLTVGPMAISGSTRLQSTTALTWAVFSALLEAAEKSTVEAEADFLLEFLRSQTLQGLKHWIECESKIYQAHGRALYRSKTLATTVFTDLTERSPTFSLPGLENKKLPITAIPWSFFILPNTFTPEEAWNKLLGRVLRTLSWPELKGKFDDTTTYGFDFSEAARKWRHQLEPTVSVFEFQIEREPSTSSLLLSTPRMPTKNQNSSGSSSTIEKVTMPCPGGILTYNLVAKILLNTISTMVMGRMGRFESNIMIWVRPSNNKLIDRAIRYIAHLLTHQGQNGHKIDLTYDDIAAALFSEMTHLNPNESIVLKTVESIAKQHLIR